MSTGTTTSVSSILSQRCVGALGKLRWPIWFSSHGASDGMHSAPHTASRPRRIVRIGQIFARFIVLLVAVSVGMHVALAALEGVGEIARKTAVDPLGMIFASCIVTVGLLLTSFCYGVLRNQLTYRNVSGRVIGLWYGFVYAIAMTFSVAGLSELFQLAVGPEVRQALPTEIDFIFLVLSMALASVLCIELATLQPWKHMRLRGRDD